MFCKTSAYPWSYLCTVYIDQNKGSNRSGAFTKMSNCTFCNNAFAIMAITPEDIEAMVTPLMVTPWKTPVILMFQMFILWITSKLTRAPLAFRQRGRWEQCLRFQWTNRISLIAFLLIFFVWFLFNNLLYISQEVGDKVCFFCNVTLNHAKKMYLASATAQPGPN